jgi:GR25 family glycosyltransferase involved in LPS biosynthesis
MLPTIVINLKERNDRFHEFMKSWRNFNENILIQEGIRNPMPHSGCGLAHISAIKRGLQQAECCIVMEDDVDLIDEKVFREYIEKLYKKRNCFDCAVFNPNHDDTPMSPIEQIKVWKVNEDKIFKASPTHRLIGTHCCFWTKRSLPKILEYEEAIQKNYFLPIDRLLFNDHWYSHEITTWETCIDRAIFLEKTINMFPPNIKWNTPETWIVVCNAIKLRDSLSDHTGIINRFPDTFPLYKHFIDSSKNDDISYVAEKSLNIREIQ